MFADGSAAVLHLLDRKLLRIRGSRGKELLFGGESDGSSFFRGSVQLVMYRGTDVIALDRFGRVASIDSRGTTHATYQLRDTLPGEIRIAIGALDGGIVAYAPSSSSIDAVRTRSSEAIETGRAVIFRDTVFVIGYDSTGGVRRWMGPLVAGTSVTRAAVSVMPNGRRAITPVKEVALPVVRERNVTMGAGVIYVFRDAENEIDAYSLTDGLMSVSRLAAPLENRTHVSGMSYPASRDRMRGFIADDAGRLWFEIQPTSMNKHWLVLDAHGQLVGRATTPARIRPIAIGGGFLTGQVEDSHRDVVALRIRPPTR